MKKVKVIYLESTHSNPLFQEEIYYCDIPPKGRIIKWHNIYWEVDSVFEDWDADKVEVTFIKINQ